TLDVFLRDTDYRNNRHDLRGGFSTSTWPWIALKAHYRRLDTDSDYDHLRDESPACGAGYSAFIRHREIVTDEVEAKLVLHPVSWLKATLTYQWTASEFSTATDPFNDPFFYGLVTPGGGIVAGNYRANVYGLNVTFVPSPRLNIFGTFTWSDSRTLTWAQNEVASVVPYEGNTYNVMASANYALNSRTGLQA